MKNRFIRLSEDFHHPIHLMIGLIIGLLYFMVNPGLELDKVMLYAGLGGLVPDVDHLLFTFIYGRSTDYAKITRKFLRKREFRKLAAFLKSNHKNNNGIYSHNLFTVIVIYILTISARNRDHIYLAIFLISCIFHFLFDVVEDFIYFGRINPNWFLRFNNIKEKDLKNSD